MLRRFLNVQQPRRPQTSLARRCQKWNDGRRASACWPPATTAPARLRVDAVTQEAIAQRRQDEGGEPSCMQPGDWIRVKMSLIPTLALRGALASCNGSSGPRATGLHGLRQRVFAWHATEIRFFFRTMSHLCRRDGPSTTDGQFRLGSAPCIFAIRRGYREGTPVCCFKARIQSFLKPGACLVSSLAC